MIVEFLQRDVAAPFGPQDLALEAVNLNVEDLDLMDPLLEPARPTALRQVKAAGLRGYVSDGMRDRAIVLNRPANLVPTGIQEDWRGSPRKGQE